MQITSNTNIERIIAKIDNDFNLDNTDWVPRVAAWVVDVLSILKVTPTKKQRVRLPVKGRIAYSACPIEFSTAKVYDENGCEVTNIESDGCGCGGHVGSTSTGSVELSNTMSHVHTDNPDDNHGSVNVPLDPMGRVIYGYNPTFDYNKHNSHLDIGIDNPIDMTHRVQLDRVINGRKSTSDRHFIDLGCNKIELTYDADYVTVEYEGIETDYSDTYKCELPKIPNNGKLIEAIVYYCMYKILCRGYKHPVFNLSASQYGTNPYYMWTILKDQARKSVIAGEGEIDDKHAWDYAMVDFMFK